MNIFLTYNLFLTTNFIVSSILITIISWNYLNLSLPNEYVCDVTIPTQVSKYNQCCSRRISQSDCRFTSNLIVNKNLLNIWMWLIISHYLECEMGQFHLSVHNLHSETRLADCLMKENVKLNLESSHLTLLILTDYFFSHCSTQQRIICKLKIAANRKRNLLLNWV